MPEILPDCSAFYCAAVLKNVLVNMSTSYSGVSQVAKEWPFVFNADQKAMGTHGKNEAIIARVADLECPVCDRDATFTAALA